MEVFGWDLLQDRSSAFSNEFNKRFLNLHLVPHCRSIPSVYKNVSFKFKSKL